MDKTVQVRDLVIGEGRPKICIPVMGSTTETLKEAAGHAMKKHPDLIEWRADYFADIENEEVRRQAFDELREILGEVPLLFTIRTRREGGEADLSADQYLKVVSDAIRDEKADLVDVEISHGDDIAFMLISLAHEFGIKTIASSHDFSQTPKKEQIIMTLCKMQELEADIPKMAVMPQRERCSGTARCNIKYERAPCPDTGHYDGHGKERCGIKAVGRSIRLCCDIWDSRSTVRTGTDRCGRIKEDFGTFGRRLMSTKKQNTRSQF